MRKHLLPMALVLLLTIPLVLVLWDFTREVFLVELWRIVWGARILFESLPQLPLWALFLVTALVMAVRSLTRDSGPAQEATAGEAEYEGRVQILTRWIQHAAQGEYFRWSLAQHLGGLTWEVMAHRERTTPQQLKQHLRTGRLDLPPVIQTYLQTSRAFGFTTSAGLSKIKARSRAGAPARPPDPALVSVVEFLEHQLEVEHDHRNH